ncbi:MAG: hypothetical protein MRJ68_11180 [Nitrospira sp.]|nr:hypothetical protein [Nitrospira sp.]
MTPVSNVEKESSHIKLHGGARSGAGRPPGSPNKITRPVRELAAQYSEDSILTLVDLRDHAESEQVRFAAAKELLDRAYGRPRQEISVADRTINVLIPPPPPPLVDLTKDALMIENESTYDPNEDTRPDHGM